MVHLANSSKLKNKFLKKLAYFSRTTLLKKFTSKVDGFTFVHFCLKVITSDVKVLYDLLMLYVRRYYLLREVAWHSNLLANQPSVNIGYLLPINSFGYRALRILRLKGQLYHVGARSLIFCTTLLMGRRYPMFTEGWFARRFQCHATSLRS